MISVEEYTIGSKIFNFLFSSFLKWMGRCDLRKYVKIYITLGHGTWIIGRMSTPRCAHGISGWPQRRYSQFQLVLQWEQLPNLLSCNIYFPKFTTQLQFLFIYLFFNSSLCFYNFSWGQKHFTKFGQFQSAEFHRSA